MFAQRGGNYHSWLTFIISYCLMCTAIAHKHTGPRTTTTAGPVHARELIPPVEIVGVHEENPETEHVIPERTKGWSQWSPWSVCSRTCDGGVARQLRTCGDSAGCRGEPVRYKICNMQPCRAPNSTEPVDPGSSLEDAWRAQQCSAHDSSPYGGELFHWTPHRDDAEPCALTCRGTPHRGRHNHEEEERVLSDEDEATAVVIAVLAPRVQDGTRCRPGNLDMCIDGRCQKVGCDLRVGSTRRVDACGVCGGEATDGAECARPRYRWAAAPASLCSATCGGGYKMSLSVCRDRVSGTDVSDQLCDASSKPAPAVVRCNPHPCPYKWYVGEWSSCSRTCGGGVRSRRVQCARAASSSSAGVSAPANVTCAGTPPPRTTPCAQRECPRWISGQWSGCSVSCGSGVQMRGAECVGGPNPGEGCDHTVRPETSRSCSTGIVCPDYRDTGNEDDIEDLIPGVVYHTQPLIQPYPPPQAKAEKLIGEQNVPSEATFIKDSEWGPCSVTCGEGLRKKEVHCKIFLEFSRTIAKLPDYKCSGPKPSEETERCVMEPCSMAYGTSFGDSNQPSLFPSDSHRSPSYGDTNIRVAPGVPGKSYSWKEKGYTSCSASCLSGVQELIIQCVRDEDQKNASPYMCDPFTKPESRLRTCNDHPCPPRWNYTEFTSCSKTCGIGIQTREVNCIHEVTRGGVNTVVVPNNMCPQPPPPDRQYCNVLDCPVKWHAGEWSKCSKTCSGGIKERKVECKQVMAQSHIVERPDALCASSRPPATKPCNTKPCVLDTSSPHIAQANSSYIQHDAKKKKITVVVGASATLFFGTQVRIKCPVKGYNRTKIQWAKDHTFITKSKKFKITKKGALRINELHYRDMGIYTCVAGRSTANLNLIVKHRPGEYVSSEEIERQRASPLEDSDAHDGLNRNIGRYTGQLQGTDSEDQSHEQRPGEISSKKQNKNKQVGKEKQSYATATTTGKVPTQFSQHDNNYEDDEESSMPSHIVSMAEKSDVHVATSGGNRVMPYLKYFFANFQILWPFQVLGRGQRTVDTITSILSSNKPILHLSSENLIYTDEENRNEVTADDRNNGTLNTDKNVTANSGMDVGKNFNMDSIIITTTSTNRPIQESRLILSELKWEQVYYDWIVTEWSPCSHSCGGQGHQIRGVSCVMQRENETRPVETSHCTDPGDDPPASVRSCGRALCTSWEAEEWPECEKSRCYDWNTAMQRRTVYCRASNGTRLSQSYCQTSLRPSHRRECRKTNCQAVWKTDQWSECRADCSQGVRSVGSRYRVLRCVWAGSGAPAGAACGALPRPDAARACTRNCTGRKAKLLYPSCRDSSKFCSNVRTMKMCRIHRYKALCCKTCRH